MISTKVFYKQISLTAIFIVSFFLASHAEAASLYLTSSNSKVTVGSLVTINLLVNTQGKTINNAEATLQFSNDLIDVISVKGSLFSLWVESPSFSNSSGVISFNGGIPDPGYNGGGAKVLTIVAKAKKAGTASFLFGDAAVRENDGLGTDILSGQSPVSFLIASNVSEPEVKPSTPSTPSTPNNPEKPVTPPANEGVGEAVAISSPTYSNSETWSLAKSGVINWGLPNKTSAVETLIDHNPYSTPSVKYAPAIFSKNISDLDDGTWYFHLRYLLNNNWSKVSHFKIQVDTTPPSDFSVAPEKTNNCIAGLRLSAKDATSGIDYYNINIDDQSTVKVLAADAANIIPLPQSEDGRHKILATVYDKAGNKTDLSTEINSERLNAPILNALPSEVLVGDKLNISGQSDYHNAPLKLAINSESGVSNEFDLTTDESGKFFFNSESIANEGNYKISVYAVGCNEMTNSVITEISVTAKTAITGSTTLKPISVTPAKDYSLIFNLLKVLAVLILLFGWYKYIIIERRLFVTKKRAKRLSVEILLDKANKELAVLEKAKKLKKLNRNEEKSVTNLKKIISDIDSLNRNKK